MMSAILSGVPVGLWIFLVVALLVGAVLVLYALYSKGDVKAVFSHGTTVFKLEAKSRQPKN
jgi:hypothetical protein